MSISDFLVTAFSTNSGDAIYSSCGKYYGAVLVKENQVIIPVFYYSIFKDIFDKYNDAKKLVTPLSRESHLHKAPSLLKAFRLGHPYQLTTWKIKDKTYFLNKSIVIDESLNVLYMPAFVADIVEANGKKVLKINHPVCYISPKVYAVKDVVTKIILQKIIPYFATTDVFISSLGWEGRCPVVIQKPPFYITKVEMPTTPSISQLNQELRQLVIDNI